MQVEGTSGMGPVALMTGPSPRTNAGRTGAVGALTGNARGGFPSAPVGCGARGGNLGLREAWATVLVL